VADNATNIMFENPALPAGFWPQAIPKPARAMVARIK
jgi:hypothetical protein